MGASPRQTYSQLRDLEIRVISSEISFSQRSSFEAETGSYVVDVIRSFLSMPISWNSPSSAHSSVAQPVALTPARDLQYPGTSSNTTKWVFGQIGGVSSSLAIGSDGTIYAVSNDLHLYAINSDGSIKWTQNLGETGYAPLLSPNGTIFVPTATHVQAFAPTGLEEWSLPTAPNNGTNLAISDSLGMIYSVNDQNLYSIRFNGKIAWETKVGCSDSSPVIGPDGTIYCRGTGSSLTSNLVRSKPQWNHQVDGSNSIWNERREYYSGSRQFDGRNICLRIKWNILCIQPERNRELEFKEF